MKRIWIGIGLLIACLGLGLWVSGMMERNNVPGAEDLKQAAQYAMRDDWDKAEARTARARKNWQKKWHVTASVASHEPMDEIDALFEELKIYSACEDSVSYSGTCAYLAQLLQALSESQKLSWWNLL